MEPIIYKKHLCEFTKSGLPTSTAHKVQLRLMWFILKGSVVFDLMTCCFWICVHSVRERWLSWRSQHWQLVSVRRFVSFTPDTQVCVFVLFKQTTSAVGFLLRTVSLKLFGIWHFSSEPCMLSESHGELLTFLRLSSCSTSPGKVSGIIRAVWGWLIPPHVCLSWMSAAFSSWPCSVLQLLPIT